MNTEQKFKLSLTTIISTVVSLTVIVLVWVVLTNNPTSVNTMIDFRNQKIELNCTFVGEDNGEMAPNK